jgi:predicted nucleic acid-binding protein
MNLHLFLPDGGPPKQPPRLSSASVKVVLDNTILVRAHEQAHGLGQALLTTLIESKYVVLLSNERVHELKNLSRNTCTTTELGSSTR